MSTRRRRRGPEREVPGYRLVAFLIAAALLAGACAPTSQAPEPTAQRPAAPVAPSAWSSATGSGNGAPGRQLQGRKHGGQVSRTCSTCARAAAQRRQLWKRTRVVPRTGHRTASISRGRCWYTTLAASVTLSMVRLLVDGG
jgi:hypothetical protein